jgi:hypothetical protein
MPGDLGLLADGYFHGFAAIQLPLGKWLDTHGPKRVSMGFLSLAVLRLPGFFMGQQLHMAACSACSGRHGRGRLPHGPAHRLQALV